MTWPTQASGISYDKGYGITSLSDGSSIVTGAFGDHGLAMNVQSLDG